MQELIAKLRELRANVGKDEAYPITPDTPYESILDEYLDTLYLLTPTLLNRLEKLEAVAEAVNIDINRSDLTSFYNLREALEALEGE